MIFKSSGRLLLRNFASSMETTVTSNLNKNTVLGKIIANTKVSRSHLTPEIALRLITPECKIFFEPVQEADALFPSDPFWGFYWPGGQAISRYLLDNPHVVTLKRVLDVGSGSGACAIAAVMSGAKYAIANDIDEVAAIAAEHNSEMNNVKIQTSSTNQIGNACKDTDILLLGDLFYDSEFAGILLPWLQKLRSAGKEVLVGDPGRHGLTKDIQERMKLQATYELPENCCIENNGFRKVNVWKFL